MEGLKQRIRSLKETRAEERKRKMRAKEKTLGHEVTGLDGPNSISRIHTQMETVRMDSHW